MPTDASNFTTPDNRIDPLPNSTQPAQDNAYWDPVEQRWKGRTSGDGREMPSTMGARPPGSTWDTGTMSWVPAGTQSSDGSTNIQGSHANPGATTEGRVDVNTAADGYNSGGSWGGYSGTMVRMPDGSLVLDQSLSGRAADVNDLRDKGAAMAGREAYQNDYTQANQDAEMAAGIRMSQGTAAEMARSAAMGAGTPQRDLGRSMLAQGANTQQAAAMSTRGGSLAQAAAMRQQQNGQGAFMQQGNNALAAQRADDMAAGRAQYMGAVTQRRAGDAAAQGLHQGQATSQAGNEIDQRHINQVGQMGYEEMGFNVNKSAQDSTLKNEESKVGIDAAASLRGQQQADRNLGLVGTAASAGGALLGGLGNAFRDEGKEKPKPDPYSDVRTKMGVRSLAAAAAARRGY